MSPDDKSCIGWWIFLDQNKTHLKCKKCLEMGHKAADCVNDWKCLDCLQSGHRRGECNIEPERVVESDVPQKVSRSESESETDRIERHSKANVSEETREEKPKNTRKSRKSNPKDKTVEQKESRGAQRSMDHFVKSAKNNTDTPNKGKNKLNANRSPPTPVDGATNTRKKSRTVNRVNSDESSVSDYSDTE